MSSRQPVALNAMLCPHCMSVNDVAATICSRCGAAFGHESPGLAPLAGTAEGERDHGALTARAPSDAAANEPVHGEDERASAEPSPHRFNRVQVVFRDDGSALLEYSDAPPGEEAVADAPTAAATAPDTSLPTVGGQPEGAAQLPVPAFASEPLMATAAPAPSGQWAAGPASMTAFAVGAAVATLLLVSGYLVYRSLAPSDTPTMAAQPPPAAVFERPTDARSAARTRPSPAPSAAVAPTPAAAPLATTSARQQSAAPITDSGRLTASPAARAPVAAPTTRGAESPPPPPVNVPCNPAVAALGLCTPTQPGRP